MTFDSDEIEEGSFKPTLQEWGLKYSLEELVQAAYSWQGEHHKMWFIEQIAAKIGIELSDPGENERGIAP